MWKLFLTALMLFSSGLILAGCDRTSSGSLTNESEMTDTGLEYAIKAKLNSYPEIKSANLEVTADAAKNEATLAGSVESEPLKRRVVEIAKTVRTGLVVIDKIEVQPGEVSRSSFGEKDAESERAKANSLSDKLGSSVDDAWIHMKIVAKLIGRSDTPERKINVDVVDKNVTLRGTVETSDQKAEAESVARNTEGVNSVHNLLKVATIAKRMK